MMLLLFIPLGAAAFAYPKSRKITALILLLMWFMYGLCAYGGDYLQYEYVYNNFSSGAFNRAYEPGYVALMRICTMLHFSFVQFRCVLGAIYVFVGYLAVRRMTDCTALAMIILTLFPFFVFTAVMRSAIASVIVLYAFSDLVRGTVSGRVRFAVGVLIGVLFHYSSIVFLVFLVVRGPIRIHKFLLYFAATFILALLFFTTGIPYAIVSRITSSPKVLQWFVFGATTNLTGAVAELVVLALTTLMTWLSRSRIDRQADAPQLHRDVARVAEGFSFFMLMLFPIMIFTAVFMRLNYMAYALPVVSCLNAAYPRKKRDPEELPPAGRGYVHYLVFFLVGMTLLWAFYYDLPYLKQGSYLYQTLILPKLAL